MKITEDQFTILIKYIDEAITSGRRGTDTTYTAPGIAWHAAQEMGLLKEDGK